jgi:DNA mismatch endonuclease, patch repair protein
MSGIRGTNTQPEIRVRRMLHRLGFRFRIHSTTLPGKPDMVFPRFKAVLFVHGCFWHGHGCHLFKWPSSRPEFWRDKIGRNQANDRRATDTLEKAGWRVAIVWECVLKGRTRLDDSVIAETLAKWLRSENAGLELPFKARIDK